eukprot:403349151
MAAQYQQMLELEQLSNAQAVHQHQQQQIISNQKKQDSFNPQVKLENVQHQQQQYYDDIGMLGKTSIQNNIEFLAQQLQKQQQQKNQNKEANQNLQMLQNLDPLYLLNNQAIFEKILADQQQSQSIKDEQDLMKIIAQQQQNGGVPIKFDNYMEYMRQQQKVDPFYGVYKFTNPYAPPEADGENRLTYENLQKLTAQNDYEQGQNLMISGKGLLLTMQNEMKANQPPTNYLDNPENFKKYYEKIVKCVAENRPDELVKYIKLFKECKKLESLREPYQKDTDWTLLHFTAKNNHPETAKLLIEAGLNVNSKDAFHRTPLIEASVHGSVEVARLLIQSGANVNLFNKYQNTALHVAAQNNQIEICNLLIQYKADVMKKNYESQTCLDIAIARGFPELTDILDYHYRKEVMWKNRNCLLKIYLAKEKTSFKNLSLGVFREIIKYA